MSSSNLVHSPPTHILCLTPCIKARKSFHGVLPCLVMMYHQTNLDCKSFSISEDLAETIVVWPWTSQNYISEWYSGWWWCITILSLTKQRYCSGKHSLKFRTITQSWTIPRKYLRSANFPIAMSQMVAMKILWFLPKKAHSARNNDAFTHCGISLISPNILHQKYSSCLKSFMF